MWPPFRTQARREASMYGRSRQARVFIEHRDATLDERIVARLQKFFNAWEKPDFMVAWWPESATTDRPTRPLTRGPPPPPSAHWRTAHPTRRIVAGP
jgi:hypothetical protein